MLHQNSQSHQDDILEEVKFRIRKLNVGQVIVGLCIIGLSVWCLVNVEQIIHKYYSYETIISLQNDPPSETGFPGITICAPSIFRPQDLAFLFPEFGKRFDSFTRRIKSIQPDIFADIQITKELDHNNALFLRYESLALKTHNASEIIKTHSVRLDDLIVECQFHSVNIRSFQRPKEHHRIGSKICANIQPVLESIYEGKKCFTFFSDLYDVNKKSLSDVAMENLPNQGDCDKQVRFCDPQEFIKDSHDKMVFDLNPSIEVRIKAIDNDVWKSFVKEPILMTVHPPNILQNRRDFLFFQVTRSTAFDITFTKKTTQLLEKPYKTMCIEYRKEPKYQADHIRTRDQCISVCINKFLSEKNLIQCANYYSCLTESMFSKDYSGQKICTHGNQSYSDYLEARNSCEDDCPAECLKTLYEITGQVRSQLENDCQRWYQIGRNSSEPIDFEKMIFNFPNDNTTNEPEDLEIDSYDITDYEPYDKPQPLHSTSQMRMLSYGDNKRTVRSITNPKQNFASIKAAEHNCDARVSIRISPKPFTTVRHVQAITYEGFLGTIGGHIGIWLGLSLYKIIKFVVHILYNGLYRVVKKCSPKFAQPVGTGSSGD